MNPDAAGADLRPDAGVILADHMLAARVGSLPEATGGGAARRSPGRPAIPTNAPVSRRRRA